MTDSQTKRAQPLTQKRNRRGRHHPDPRPGCGLCLLAHTDPLLISIWAAYQLPKASARRTAIEAGLAKAKAPYSVAEVERHIGRHRAVQPFPNWPQLRSSLERTGAQMKPRHWQILQFVGQAEVVSPAQIDELFFSHIKRSPGAQESHKATEVLRWMAYRHLLYRVWILGQRKQAPRALYGLGRLGAELLSSRDPILGNKPWDYLHEPGDVAPQMVPHDLGVTETFLMLRRHSGHRVIGGRGVEVGLDINNYWAAGHLSVTVRFPAYRDEAGRRHDSRNCVVRPDGFCVVGARLDEPIAAGQSFAMPLVIEHDTGIRRNREVADQLLSYCQGSAKFPTPDH